jgi:hypothetical protein
MVGNAFKDELLGGGISLFGAEIALAGTPVRNALNPEIERKIKYARFIGALYPIASPFILEFSKSNDKWNNTRSEVVFFSSVITGFISCYTSGYVCGEIFKSLSR